MGLAAEIQEPRLTFVAVAALAITIVLHPAVLDIGYHQVPEWLNITASILVLIDPILSLALLGLIGPRLWRAGGLSRAVGISALVAAFIVSASGLAMLDSKIALGHL